MRCVVVVGSCLALFLSACGSSSEPTGSYLYADADTVLMLQITNVRDGRVDATLSAVTLDKDGKLSAGARPVAGTLLDGALQLVSDTGDVRTLITGAVEKDTAELTFFTGGTSQTLVFEKRSAQSFKEHSSKLASSSEARVQAKSEADFERERIANGRLLQAQIDRLADTLTAQAAEVADGASRLRATSTEHLAAAAEIARLGGIAKGLKPGGYEASAKLQMIQSDIEYLKEDRRQANLRAEAFVARAVNMVDDTWRAAELERDCLADQQLDCRRLRAAVAKLKKGVNGLTSLKQDEQAAYVRVDPLQAEKAQLSI